MGSSKKIETFNEAGEELFPTFFDGDKGMRRR
jgi:hypothetical protein